VALERLTADDQPSADTVASDLHQLGATSKLLHRTTITRYAREQAATEGDPLAAVRGHPRKALTHQAKAARLAFAQHHLEQRTD
jgi:hypothetical protein